MIEVPRNATWLTARQRLLVTGTRVSGRVLPAGLPVLRRLVRTQTARLFGVPELGDPARTDAARFLPGRSPTRRILAEPASIAGGVRSLYVQAAHPLAMAGVTSFSRYRTAPLDRLAGTSAWVTTTAFGTVDVVHHQARRVRAMHRRVAGVHDGTPYAASDPRLLVWVSVALTSSFLASQDLFAPTRLTQAERDTFVAEQGRVAGLLDPRFDLDAVAPSELAAIDLDDLPLAADGLPRTEAALAAALASFQPELHVIPEARDAIGFLREVTMPPAVRPVYQLILDGVAASVPRSLRQALGQDVAETRGLVGLGTLLGAIRVSTGRSAAWDASSRPDVATGAA